MAHITNGPGELLGRALCSLGDSSACDGTPGACERAGRWRPRPAHGCASPSSRSAASTLTPRGCPYSSTPGDPPPHAELRRSPPRRRTKADFPLLRLALGLPSVASAPWALAALTNNAWPRETGVPADQLTSLHSPIEVVLLRTAQSVPGHGGVAPGGERVGTATDLSVAGPSGMLKAKLDRGRRTVYTEPMARAVVKQQYSS